MVHAKPEMQARARELRRAGNTYAEIVRTLGVSKSSVSLWVRDLPKPPPSPERLSRMREARWGPYRERREPERERTKAAAGAEIGPMTDRELFLVGVGLYWAEGEKDKPHRRRERIAFVNSDPRVIEVFVRWLALLGVARDAVRFRLMIHESADAAAARRHWAALVGVDAAAFGATTLKRHNPKTVRKNVGGGYRGCLEVRVRDAAELYRRVEGWWYGIVEASKRSGADSIA